MAVLVADYEHRKGEHRGSTSLRNILHFHGLEISEPMIIGLAGGLGFYYLCSDQLSPTRIFHERTATLESDFCENTGVPFQDRLELDNERAWTEVRDRIDSGQPVMISTDTYYLGYHRTGSQFPSHRVVAVGYDDSSRTAFLADRKFAEYLAEAAELVPAIGAAGLGQRMTAIASRWRDLATVLKEQSEGETCRPELFSRAGAIMEELPDAEESFFGELRDPTASEHAWSSAT